jgi:outer membrane protein assembly factor BamB
LRLDLLPVGEAGKEGKAMRNSVKTALVITAVLLLAACDELAAPTDAPPILVTLAAQTPVPTSTAATATPEVTIAPTLDLPPTLTQSVPPSPVVEAGNISSTRKLWEWTETAHPTAAAASGARLGVVISDGRFAWVNTDSGKLEASSYLWKGLIQGETWGSVFVDGLGTLAVVQANEQSVDSQTGYPEFRSRISVLDAQANELWSLPELTSQRFYSTGLTSVSVIVGTYPGSLGDNTLSAYELYTGNRIWEVGGEDTPDETFGYEQILQDGNRLYVLMISQEKEESAVAAFDLRTGDELWRWSDPELKHPDLIALDTVNLYVLSVDRMTAVDPVNGQGRWTVTSLQADPTAGIAARQGYIYLAPAPSAEVGFYPGIISLKADGSGLAWHSMSGVLANPVSADEEAVWLIAKHYESGNVWLSALDPLTGLEKLRLTVSSALDVNYQIIPFSRRIYVLGNSLLAFGY